MPSETVFLVSLSAVGPEIFVAPVLHEALDTKWEPFIGPKACSTSRITTKIIFAVTRSHVISAHDIGLVAISCASIPISDSVSGRFF